MDLEGSHPKKLIKKVNNHNPSLVSVGMSTIMKPEISPQEIPEKTELLYRPKNQSNIPQVHPTTTTNAKHQSLSEHHDHCSFQAESASISHYINTATVQTIKAKQDAGYNIINNI